MKGVKFQPQYHKLSGKLFHNLRAMFGKSPDELCENPHLIDKIRKCMSTSMEHQLYLLNCPKVVMFNIGWNVAEQTVAPMYDLLLILQLIPNIFKPSLLFSKMKDPQMRQREYLFKGMVCFYGCHYFSYYRDCTSPSKAWSRYDDTRITPIATWQEVVYKCLMGHEQPILLLFESIHPDNLPVVKDKFSLNEAVQKE